MIPLFQFTRNYRSRCQDVECFENMVLTIPNTTNEVFQCIKRNICQIGNANLKTHVRTLYNANNRCRNLCQEIGILVIIAFRNCLAFHTELWNHTWY